ncbi:MAG: hypothetical protein ACPLY7_01575 [Microgenomates group bacterium]
MKKKNEIRVGVDLDGVVAKHSFGGLWVKLRVGKEKFLKKVGSRTYYYPKTKIEQFTWLIINWSRVPDKEGLSLLKFLKKSGFRFYLISSRLNFNCPSTIKWLKKYKLIPLFEEVFLNNQDQNPISFKREKVKEKRIDYFVDDDLEVLEALCVTGAKLFWVVPGHRNGDENHHGKIQNCQSFKEALEKISLESRKNIV